MENWKPISGWEGLYEVSDIGRIRSVERVVRCRDGTRTAPSVVRKLNPNRKGYLQAHLSAGDRRAVVAVHLAVATAFIPNPKQKPTVNHRHGDKRNNAATNLEWATFVENNNHALATGLRVNPRGSLHGMAVLNEVSVLAIKRELAEGKKQNAIAREWNVSNSLINQIANGAIWQHVSLSGVK